MMDLTTTLIGLIMIALIFLPMYYFHRVQKAKKNKFEKGFLTLAVKQGLTLAQHEVWGCHCAIGIDTFSNKLVYLKKLEEQEPQQAIIDLAEVEKCGMINLKRANGEDQVIDRLELIFSFKNSNKPQKQLEIYVKDDGLALYDERVLLEKWHALINEQLIQQKSTKPKTPALV